MADDKKNEAYLNPNYVKEWEISRGILDRFDGYLNDLRKYGFTLITALLALSAFLLPYSSQIDPTTGLVTTSNFPDSVKFVVLLVNLLVIVAATAIDRNYTVFLQAAADRARVLERALNLELTEIIGRRYRSAHGEYVITGLYSFFMIMVLTLGVFVLGHDLNLLLLLLLFVLIAIGAVVVIRTYIRVDYAHGPIDYTLDRLQCTQGDAVAITLTNLEKSDMVIKSDEILWEIKGEISDQEDSPVWTKTADKEIRIGDRDSYTTFWETDKNVGKGIYEVWRPEATKGSIFGRKGETRLVKNEELKRTKLVLLLRTIRVYEKPPESPQTDLDEILKMIKKLLNC